MESAPVIIGSAMKLDALERTSTRRYKTADLNTFTTKSRHQR